MGKAPHLIQMCSGECAMSGVCIKVPCVGFLCMDSVSHVTQQGCWRTSGPQPLGVEPHPRLLCIVALLRQMEMLSLCVWCWVTQEISEGQSDSYRDRVVRTPCAEGLAFCPDSQRAQLAPSPLAASPPVGPACLVHPQPCEIHMARAPPQGLVCRCGVVTLLC